MMDSYVLLILQQVYLKYNNDVSNVTTYGCIINLFAVSPFTNMV